VAVDDPQQRPGAIWELELDRPTLPSWRP